ncbi:MAG: NAD-dependent epimerase/dehydratase family protein [Myxococcota bacterium]
MQLVTGGAGFLGSHLVDALVRMGKRVRVLDALIARPGEDGARQRDRVAKFGRAVDFVEGDVRDPLVVQRAMVGVKRVFHLGHFTGSRMSMPNAAACLETNVLGTQVVLDAMDAARVPSLVLCSHGCVYGEVRQRGAREGDAPSASTPFAASMVAAEALATAWQTTSRGAVSIVRPFTTYGPRMRPGSSVRAFLEAADSGRDAILFGQDTSRDYVFASDVVRVLVEARRVRSERGPAIFNAASGRPVGILELVREMEVITGSPIRTAFAARPPGDLRGSWGDPAHTSDKLGVRARTTLPEGLATTLRWLRKRPADPRA